MRNLLLIIAFLAICLHGFGKLLSGSVTEYDGSPLPGVTITIRQPGDSAFVRNIVSDIEGRFNVELNDSSIYTLKASMTSMETVEKTIPVLVDSVSIIMTENAIMLDEAIITATKAAVVAKQDTLEFNAGSFRTAPNATVNELLKKLPGVEVGTDGSITAQGKNVTKILVDGKEFFSDDPQMASKNLPSNMVDKVQVIDRKSDLARLTGVDDGEEETIINLTVKKDMQNGIFGNVGAGYGTDNRYQGSFVINNFYNGNQITLLGGFNNINENGFSDRGRGRFRDFGGSGGITEAQRLGLNFNVGKDEEIRVGGNVLYSHTDRKIETKKATQFLFPDSVRYQESGSRIQDKGHNVSSDFRLQWKIDPQNTLDFRPRFSFNFRDAQSNDSSTLRSNESFESLVNNNLNRQNNRGTNFEVAGNLIFNHNFLSRPGRSLSLNVSYSFSRNRQKALTWNEIIYYLLLDSDEELFRLIDNKTFSNSVDTRLTWTEPLGDPAKGNFLTLAYRMRYQASNADKLTYSLDPFIYNPDFNLSSPDEIIYPEFYDPNLSDRFRNKFFTQEIQLGYRKVKKNLNLDAGILFSPSSSKSNNLINAGKSIPTRWVFNVSPYANLRLRFAEKNSMRLTYRARTNQPSMTQLQPVADVSDPLNIIIGNPELKPTFSQSFGIHFNDYRSESQQSLAVMANGSFAINSIVAKTVSNPETGGRTTTYGNVNGNFNIFGVVMLNRPFRNRNWRFNVRMNARYASTPGYINGNFNRTENLSLSPAAGITFSNDFMQISVNPSYSFGNISNTLPDQKGRRTHSYGFTSDLLFSLPFGVDFSTDFAFSDNTGLSAGFDNRQWLWNAQVSYSFLSDKSLTLAVKGYDILGMKKNISRSVSASSIIDSQYNELTRYVMVSLTWSFNTIKKKQSSNDFNPEGDFPPPPSEGINHGNPPADRNIPGAFPPGPPPSRPPL